MSLLVGCASGTSRAIELPSVIASALSKSTRVIILLARTSSFFVLVVGVG